MKRELLQKQINLVVKDFSDLRKHNVFLDKGLRENKNIVIASISLGETGVTVETPVFIPEID